MKKLIKSVLADKQKLGKSLFVLILVLSTVFLTDITAYATQNEGYGYGYDSAGEYGYGYGYWTEQTPTVSLKYNLCTASCSISESTAMTITATFGSAVAGTPQVKVVEGSTTTLAFTNMSGSSTSWTYAYTTGSVGASTTATVSLQTLGGDGYTPTPSNATFTITDSAAAVGGGGGSAAGITTVAETTTAETTTTTTTTTPTTTTTTTVAVPAEVIPKQAEVKNVASEKEGLAAYINLTTSLPSGDGWKTVHFIAYGTEPSKKMSVNDRKGVIGDYKDVYGRVPTSDKDWSDINAILSSQKPSQRVLKAEQTALKDFVKVYKKLPNFKISADELALYYIGYNIRSATRNLNSEKAAITTFKNNYGVKPSTSHQWAIVRAIAYSGAKK